MLSKHIDFKGMNNLRDLGGMTNVFEKKIKNNLLFRSDHLHNATQADMEKLKKLGVRYILDLRNLEERTEQPDQKIEGITYIPMSLSPERNAGIAKDKKSREELQKDAIKKASADPKFFFYEMSGYYADYATVPYTLHQMHNFFQTLLQTNGGVLWHCAGGKDRTGILTVLLCEVLQIPKKDIEADYLATNLYKQKEADAEIINIQKILPPDCPPDVAVYMTKYTWLAHIEYLQHFYNLIEENHGSIQNFLRNAVGLTEDEENALRNKYLI